jgi:hypothetical protein
MGTNGKIIWPLSGKLKLSADGQTVTVEKGQTTEVAGGKYSYQMTVT